MMWNLFVQIFILLAGIWQSHQTQTDVQLQELFSWKYPDFTYADDTKREEAKKSKAYIPENNIVLDAVSYAAPNQNKLIFATTPAVLSEGYPATLSIVSDKKNGETLLLDPFPSWEANDKSSCEGLISVYRMQVNKCGHLWALDSGVVNLFVSGVQKCPPKLVVFDLNSQDQRAELLRYEFSQDTLKPESSLLNLVVESSAEDCSDSIAYIADVTGYGLLLFSLQDKTSWRVNSPRFYPYPEYGIFTVNEITFSFMDGIFGLALSASNVNPPILYWQCLTSIVESWVPTAILKDKSAISNVVTLNKEIQTSESARVGQSTVMVMTEGGVLIYAVLTDNAIYCWNSKNPFTKENQILLFQDNENFQFISGMKLIGTELLITSTKLQKFVVGATVPDEIKYRILLIGNVDDLLKGTKCL